MHKNIQNLPDENELENKPKKPWPMAWVVVAILLYVLIYNIILYFSGD